MNFTRFVPAISITVVLALILYLLFADPLPRETRHTAASQYPFGEQQAPPRLESRDTTTVPAPVARRETQQPQPPAESGIVEVSGHVLDQYGQPVEDALVSVERYPFKARSDDKGRYLVRMQIPGKRLPTLVYQRRGYHEKRIHLKPDRPRQERAYELDVSLEATADSVDLRGWVGNELGIGLEGAWVGLTSREAASAAGAYRTVLTDPQGGFVFEGVIAGEDYKLSANLSPDYPYYEDSGFVVSQTPGLVQIVLPRLHYADFDGMILDRESRPVPGYEIYIKNLSSGYHVRKIVSDSSGFFRLEHFPVGEVSLSTQGAEHLEVSSLTLADDRYRNLTIMVDRGDRYLSGWINDRGGASVKNALITLQRGYRRGPVEYRSYRSRTTGTSGRFAFTELGGGEYQVSVFAPGYQRLVFSHRLETPADEINLTLQALDGDSG